MCRGGDDWQTKAFERYKLGVPSVWSVRCAVEMEEERAVESAIGFVCIDLIFRVCSRIC